MMTISSLFFYINFISVVCLTKEISTTQVSNPLAVSAANESQYEPKDLNPIFINKRLSISLMVLWKIYKHVQYMFLLRSGIKVEGECMILTTNVHLIWVISIKKAVWTFENSPILFQNLHQTNQIFDWINGSTSVSSKLQIVDALKQNTHSKFSSS